MIPNQDPSDQLARQRTPDLHPLLRAETDVAVDGIGADASAPGGVGVREEAFAGQKGTGGRRVGGVCGLRVDGWRVGWATDAGFGSSRGTVAAAAAGVASEKAAAAAVLAVEAEVGTAGAVGGREAAGVVRVVGAVGGDGGVGGGFGVVCDADLEGRGA